MSGISLEKQRGHGDRYLGIAPSPWRLVVIYQLCQKTKPMNILGKINCTGYSYMCIHVIFHILMLSKILCHFLTLKF